jgi:hypothetical protein
VSWKFANHSGEETLVHTDLEFGTVEEAIRAAVEFGPELLPGFTDSAAEKED